MQEDIARLFHPAVAGWFTEQFGAATACQREAWPAIRGGSHTLIAAPTGSGKTLAAFLCAIDDLVREGDARGRLDDATRVVYVSPLKALSNDIQKNLQAPIAGIRDQLLMQRRPDVEVRAWVRTGDTPPAERERMRRCPPHIVVTTPESLFIMLSSESGRRMFATVETVIVDEIHALAGNKRGAHLALSLERLEACAGRALTRIGLSATQSPIELVAGFLTGTRGSDGGCRIVDMGHVRERDVALEMPASPLEAVMSGEVWSEVYDRLAALAAAQRTTLIFVNTRRLAERVARHLAERLGDEAVTSHHGSLSRSHRLQAEQRLKEGALRALVATSSLELGIDIGDVDLVCQIGSPRSLTAFLQRVGRSGHAVGALPKGRLFPTSRDDLVECTALVDAIHRGELDRLHVPPQPLDVLSQQIVAEVASREWGEEELFALFRQAWPYRALERGTFDEVVRMLAAGYSTRRGRRGAYLHHDTVNARLRPRRGARLVAITNGGAIPDHFDYDVVMEPEGVPVGTLNEDFAFESLPGDIFQLGNTSYRILRVERGTVRVEDARGAPPTIPFWFGEAPGRSDELSAAVSRLRAKLDALLGAAPGEAREWLLSVPGIGEAAAGQLVEYLGAARAALGVLPTAERVVLERFFDESGDTHLVIHSPRGSRLNRAWGLALRKCFCRRFNFELQAAALEDSIVLSLGNTHSFPLEEAASYLRRPTAREVLVQALLAAPMFATRWRWNASIALAVRRNRNGRRMPAQLQRMDAEDLMAVVFPDQLACAENLDGHREVPDHPLVNQTVADCLHEAMDVEGLERVLEGIESGGIEILARDLVEPSPLAHEVLTARPYAFLDDAPAEERRTMAVQARRFLAADDAAALGRLDEDAIARVRSEAWPEAAGVDELHDALVVLGFVNAARDELGPAWPRWLDELVAARRATRVRHGDTTLWVAAERLAEMQAVHPGAVLSPPVAPAPGSAAPADSTDALRELVRGRLEGLGPVTRDRLAADLDMPGSRIDAVLAMLEAEGFAMRGHFSAGVCGDQWCDRRLLARIHRYTVDRLRKEIEPVAAADCMRFLLTWQHLGRERMEGAEGLAAVLEQLEGFEAPAAAWEAEILPSRVSGYVPADLDRLCQAGRFQWLRLPGTGRTTSATPVRSTPVAIVRRRAAATWQAVAGSAEPAVPALSAAAGTVREVLAGSGALFFDEIVEAGGMLPAHTEKALAELVAAGLVTADSFAGLRALLVPAQRRRLRGRRGRASAAIDEAGRWTLVRGAPPAAPDAARTEAAARTLVARYGVVFRALVTREGGRLPPWRELLPVLRRLEARGELRGGRFVAGFAGEQFAHPEAVGGLRAARRRPRTGELVSVCGADPLNLTGILTPGERLPAITGNRLLLRDGVPVAMQLGKAVRFLQPMEEGERWQARSVLIRSAASAPAPTAVH